MRPSHGGIVSRLAESRARMALARKKSFGPCCPGRMGQMSLVQGEIMVGSSGRLSTSSASCVHLVCTGLLERLVQSGRRKAGGEQHTGVHLGRRTSSGHGTVQWSNRNQAEEAARMSRRQKADDVSQLRKVCVAGWSYSEIAHEERQRERLRWLE
jgi:hypothetical protein